MGELQSLESLLTELLGAIGEVIESGEVLTDEFQGLLANELEYLTTRIDDLKKQEAISGQIPPLDDAMPSSVINAFKYDPKRSKLFVQFKGKFPNSKGSIYVYDNAPKEIFELFQRGAIPAKTDGKNRWGQWWKGKVPSMGSSMNVLLKGMGLPYTKLT